MLFWPAASARSRPTSLGTCPPKGIFSCLAVSGDRLVGGQAEPLGDLRARRSRPACTPAPARRRARVSGVSSRPSAGRKSTSRGPSSSPRAMRSRSAELVGGALHPAHGGHPVGHEQLQPLPRNVARDVRRRAGARASRRCPASGTCPLPSMRIAPAGTFTLRRRPQRRRCARPAPPPSGPAAPARRSAGTTVTPTKAVTGGSVFWAAAGAAASTKTRPTRSRLSTTMRISSS